MAQKILDGFEWVIEHIVCPILWVLSFAIFLALISLIGTLGK